MSNVFLVLLLVPLFVGYRWPRWWVGLVPVVAAFGLTLATILAGWWHTTPSGDNNGAIAFLAIAALTLITEVFIFGGALLRAAVEKRRGQRVRSRGAARGGVGIAAVGFSFTFMVVTLIGPNVYVQAVLLGCALTAAVWFIRLPRDHGG